MQNAFSLEAEGARREQREILAEFSEQSARYDFFRGAMLLYMHVKDLIQQIVRRQIVLVRLIGFQFR